MELIGIVVAVFMLGWAAAIAIYWLVSVVAGVSRGVNQARRLKDDE